MTKTPLRLAALALLMTTSSALAQKIAPSRSYNDPVDTPAPTYTAPPRPTLDKSYGLPTFGSPQAAEPQQRTQGMKQLPAAPAFQPPLPDNPITAQPMGQDAMADVFARDRADEKLPSEMNPRGAGAMDTPQFTTGIATTANGASTMDRSAANRPEALFTTGQAAAGGADPLQERANVPNPLVTTRSPDWSVTTEDTPDAQAR